MIRFGVIAASSIASFFSVAGHGRAASVALNGEFTGSLASWTTEGSMFNTGDTAVFSENQPTRAAIFQSILVADTAGYQIILDCLNGLSASTGSGFVPDSFYATLYSGSQPFGSTISGSTFDAAVPLFDMDATGPFNIASGASFGPSPKGSGWTRFTLDREAGPGFPAGYLTIAFEMYNLNGTASDSVVAVDNVSLVPIPEPSAACLFASSFLLWRRRRAFPPDAN